MLSQQLFTYTQLNNNIILIKFNGNAYKLEKSYNGYLLIRESDGKVLIESQPMSLLVAGTDTLIDYFLDKGINLP